MHCVFLTINKIVHARNIDPKVQLTKLEKENKMGQGNRAHETEKEVYFNGREEHSQKGIMKRGERV